MSKKIGLFAGLSFLLITILFPAPVGMPVSAWHTAGIAFLLAVWWATEVLPIPVTSLLPILLFPALDIMTIEDSTAPYAAPTIFLLLGGFIIATGLSRWNLHRRLALNILVRVKESPTMLIAGFMGTTALISMWISNTASAIMMIPIAMSLVNEIFKDDTKRNQDFILCLILGIAYSASIGGLGTIIGTPPNLFVVSFMKQTYGIEISFADWMMFGIPVVVIMVGLAWWVLTKWACPFDSRNVHISKYLILDELKKIGKLTQAEKRITLVFLLVAIAWIIRVPVQQNFYILLWLNDAMIAVGGAVLMFMIPSGQIQKKQAALLDWESASKIPWGVLLLFGGGLSLAAAIKDTGLAIWIGGGLSGFAEWELILIMLGLVTLVIFLTELTSNTATTATLLPILGAFAVTCGIEPMLLFAPTALAASCAFMLPVATAPNAVVYSTGSVTIAQMASAGFKLNLVAIVIITTLSYLLIPILF
ncbi:solute carrier family 13 (sodium-dependent dicarboxylate transporter), member 2/3/5 [Nitrosomonas cryotolerans]|uniref:Solute carrier family 13 (Sodium-dependent dicarboxylate transporter), member 2/3/5 n=1 Tax=Nitrosomonas cryotolerans ATCC 49181 TaxID=1131553 RepID=A0A1N6J9T6_9PROT|nr:DASS family sodium-coupled anion symporter [Nitrosomonas cryotolerans]SFQ02941.1 solute carrier family 13 (sodium-dependent dicarboxylate transporter), member 2/3/5 [Nitrosomonas cryotolerans]SIO41037.1 solute carrier family 13 (sodium-dependent dicarboxylate transporter), member 2/3/5 [Nitrosomonas cryotolerans ATCC 49181]